MNPGVFSHFPLETGDSLRISKDMHAKCWKDSSKSIRLQTNRQTEEFYIHIRLQIKASTKLVVNQTIIIKSSCT